MCWPAGGGSSNDVCDATDNKFVPHWNRVRPTRAITLSQSAPKPRHLLMCKLRRTLVKQISRQKLRERLRRNQNRAQTANNRAAACGTRLTRDNTDSVGNKTARWLLEYS